ncbi:hypothetical protein C8R43DRAFT_1141086 [Mycena crocata]|nr:hypothetical protein C8R43DRAFT_1141086 [Mycena crocata]
MSFEPPSSTYTLPRRGKVVPFDFQLVDIIEAELENSDRCKLVLAPYHIAISAGLAQNLDLGEVTDTDSADGESAMATDTESESDYVPSEADAEGFISHFSPNRLRRRRPPSPLDDISPMPDVFNSTHLSFLGFCSIRWDDPRVFVDLKDRIGGFFIRTPTQRRAWENSILEATSILTRAHHDLDRTGIKDDTLSAGFRFAANGVQRPQNIPNNDRNRVILAELRASPAIQDITSLQNSMLQYLAPRAWTSAHETINTVMNNDGGLHLPFHQCTNVPLQPTAFAQVDFRFSVEDSHPMQAIRDRATGWTVFTALGHYPSEEGMLIIWKYRLMVTFPPGSTFIMPASLFSYSFAGVGEHSQRMLISQSCDGALYDFVENDMWPRNYGPVLEADVAQKERRERAERAIDMFPTLSEFDAAEGTATDLLAHSFHVAQSRQAKPLKNRAAPRDGQIGTNDGLPGDVKPTLFFSALSCPPPFPPKRRQQKYVSRFASLELIVVLTLNRATRSRTWWATRSPDRPSRRSRPSNWGSSANPIVMDERGYVQFGQRNVLRDSSSINRPTIRLARQLAGLNIGATSFFPPADDPHQARRRARIDARREIVPPPQPTLRIRSRRLAFEGKRAHRENPLTEAELYSTDARPPVKSSPYSNLECGICYSIKSHPVKYGCGHSHCYVCIRQWLEHSFECPNCRYRMCRPPTAALTIEGQIAIVHPEWQDTSNVVGTFEGLRFPARSIGIFPSP